MDPRPTCRVCRVCWPCAQAAVLMLFNDADALSYKDILAGTGLEEKELKRTLQSLACGKVGRGPVVGLPGPRARVHAACRCLRLQVYGLLGVVRIYQCCGRKNCKGRRP